ncbi:MAG: right-handed parallel beta-helix repeat-containing protein, partial [Candidatus Eisenbacteria bacterium]|nr:right-handed parallel beta-helix repeat-containing protein [Candidatus Eisenbacteria bacterium]
ASSGTAQIDNNFIWANACLSEGNGIFLNGGTNHWVHHNVIWESYDRDLVDPGDPHGIQINGVFATVEHNLVGRGDSNSLFITGSEPVVRNNIFYENGIPGVRGRGICNFGGPNTVIAHNLFFGNEIAPILTNTTSGFQDLSSAAANALSGSDGIYGNLDADPEFVDPNNHDWTLMSTSSAIDLGDPVSPLDPDGTTADAGPFYFDQSTSSVPDGRGLVPPLLARPNPFQTQTRLAFPIPASEIGGVFVIDLQGRRVAQLEAAATGTTEATAVWDGRNQSGVLVAGGVYFVRMNRTNGTTLETKLVLVDR